MAQAFHRRSFKEKVRRAALYDLARVPMPMQKPPAQERILLIRPDHLGDMLLTTPAIHALRRARPDAELHVLAGPWSAAVLADNDDIDVVLTIPFPGFSRSPKANLRSPYEQLYRSARQLRRIGYSSAVIFRPDHWWGAMLARFAGIPSRIGYDLPEVGPFLTEKTPYTGGHAVEQSLRLVQSFTGALDTSSVPLTFPVQETDRLYMRGYLEEWRLRPTDRVIVIHPGAGTAVKRWENERWAAVGDALARELDATVVLTGGDHELALAREIAAHMRTPACFVIGDTRVGQLAALYERAALVLGPDSGPLHLAVATGTPTVALFGPADPTEFGPWGPAAKHRVLTSSIACRPCRVLDWSGDDPALHPCIRDISVGQVLQAARRAVRQER
jgi:heptosyltransferase-2/heptosyltransferase-3